MEFFIFFPFYVRLCRSAVGCAAVFKGSIGRCAIGGQFVSAFSFVVDVNIGVIVGIGGAVCGLGRGASIGGWLVDNGLEGAANGYRTMTINLRIAAASLTLSKST